MNKAIIIYGSTTGNTEIAAKWVKKALSSVGADVDLFNVTDIKPESAGAYDLVILGSSTWGQGELQDDFLSFYDGMTAAVLDGKKLAAFGCGDSDMFPDDFCRAVDMIVDKAKACGAQIIAEPFKIDGDVDGYESNIAKWASGLV